jgi:hypothetical protein
MFVLAATLTIAAGLSSVQVPSGHALGMQEPIGDILSTFVVCNGVAGDCNVNSDPEPDNPKF